MLRFAFRGWLIALAAATLAAPALGQTTPPPEAAAPLVPRIDPLYDNGRNVTVSLVTAGNGAGVWELFGHTAIWLHDDVTGRDMVFNWGEFDFNEPDFILHFLQGLNWYQMGAETMAQMVDDYQRMNRTLTSQELALTATEKDSLLHLIQINAEPRNLKYRYDYFVDNCATRPRDLLDAVLRGQLHAHTNGLSGTSYRWHTLRLMQGNVPLVIGVDIGLGRPSDREITQWQEMFLPRKLHDYMATLQVRDSTGAMHPVVRSDRVLFQATGRPPEPEAPPPIAAWLWPVGGVVAALFAWLGFETAKGSRGARVAAMIILTVWCFAAGLLGVILTLLWTVTDHVFAHANENLLLFNPLWLVLAVLIAMNLWSGRAIRATRATAYLLAGLCVVAVLAHIVSLSQQSNWAIIGLALLPALSIALVASGRLAIPSRSAARPASSGVLEHA